jgi:PKHD-type hydroxylase
MSDAPLDPVMTCIVCENAFTPAELDRIEELGDGLTQGKAAVAGEGWNEGAVERLRVTRAAWIGRSPETKWLYDRIHAIFRAVNDQVYQFELLGFSEDFQYTVYHGAEGGHYDWHIDNGLKKVQRKLSMSLQLTDPARYEGCDLQFHAGQQVETAPRERGTAIVFPSYTLHRVTPITSGTRKSLVVWAAGPKFK